MGKEGGRGLGQLLWGPLTLGSFTVEMPKTAPFTTPSTVVRPKSRTLIQRGNRKCTLRLVTHCPRLTEEIRTPSEGPHWGLCPCQSA